MKNKMVRQNLDKGISLRYYTNKPLNDKCFEVRKSKRFDKLSEAQNFFKYILLEVSESAYMWQDKTGHYIIEFKTYENTYNNAVQVRDAVSPHFDLWKGRGLDV